MKITWEDRKNYGTIDNKPLQSKPVFSFEYAWFLVTDSTAQFVETHEEGFYNQDMAPEQKQEVLHWYAAWTPPVPPEVPAGPPPVPQSVTMRQARLALLGAGLLDDVEAAIAALPSPQKEAARIEWEYSQEVQRHNGFVSVLAPALGLTDEQLDDLFVQGAKL